MTPDPRDPLDPLLCPKVVFRSKRSSISHPKASFLGEKKPLRARGRSLRACISKKRVFWGEKSPCGHVGDLSGLVFQKSEFSVKIHGHREPKGRTRALGPLGPKGPWAHGPLGPPVAMYFHKRRRRFSIFWGLILDQKTLGKSWSHKSTF